MQNPQFLQLIDWYRSLKEGGEVTSSERQITFKGVFTQDLYQKTERINQLTEMGEFEDIPPSTDYINKSISFTYLPSQNEQCRFYNSIYSVLEERRTISKGNYFGNYYIIDLEFSAASDDFSQNPETNKLKNICDLITFLRELGDIDGKDDIIVFILKSAVYGNDLKISTRLTKDIFNNTRQPFLFDFNEIKDLINSTGNGAHHQEKKLLLKLAIAQFLYQKEEQSKFLSIINGWAEILLVYQNNLSSYLDNFSFEKTSLEITTEKIKIIKSINDILKDSVAKILTMPLSYGAILLAVREPNIPFINFITLVMLIVFGLVLSLSLNNQENLKNIIVSQSCKIFSSAKLAGGEVEKELKNAQNEVLKASKQLTCTLNLYHFLGWLPLMIFIFYILN